MQTYTKLLVLAVSFGVANVFAAPAPVRDLNSSSSYQSSTTSNSKETETQRLERLLNNNAKVRFQMQQQINELAQENAELRGLIEHNQYTIQQISDRQKELFLEIDRLKSAKQTESKKQDTSKPAVPSTSLNEQQAYQQAVDLALKEKNIDGAIIAFTSFNQQFPESTYSNNAYYWLGQLYFTEKKDADAVTNFRYVVKDKSSNKRSDAIFKLGLISKRNNKPNEAQKLFKLVTLEYPNTPIAEKAKKELSQ